MAHSIEARLPFLDYRLVELMFSLEPRHLIHEGRAKVILRQALADLLPPRVLSRTDKVGFSTPEARWLRGGSERLRRKFSETLPVASEASSTRKWRRRTFAGSAKAPSLQACHCGARSRWSSGRGRTWAVRGRRSGGDVGKNLQQPRAGHRPCIGFRTLPGALGLLLRFERVVGNPADCLRKCVNIVRLEKVTSSGLKWALSVSSRATATGMPSATYSSSFDDRAKRFSGERRFGMTPQFAPATRASAFSFEM